MTTYIDAKCSCGLNTFKIAFQTASLPLSSDLCHCNSCRHSSGQLAVYHVTFHGVPLSSTSNKPGYLDDLTVYKTSEKAVRYFCNGCGAHMFFKNVEKNPPSWAVAVGTLERTEGIVDVGYHIYVADTLDGGLADHFRKVNGTMLPRYAKDVDSETIPLGWRSKELGMNNESDEKLLASCHCKSISFFITRPSPASSLPYSPYPDLLTPYDVTHLSKIENTEDKKWWLRPTEAEATKYLAGHCACISCRLSSGFEIQSWAFIPRANIITRERQIELKDISMRPAGLKQYMSSPNRHREFCETCGATVFWWDDKRPDILDVSIGLLDESAGGARAEAWLEWHKARVSFSEEALSRNTVSAIIEGLAES